MQKAEVIHLSCMIFIYKLPDMLSITLGINADTNNLFYAKKTLNRFTKDQQQQKNKQNSKQK